MENNKIRDATETGLRTERRTFWSAAPEGAWAYEVDDFGLVYAEPGCGLLFTAADGTQYVDFQGGRAEAWNWVRLSPDTEYRAWNNQHVSLIEQWSEGEYRLVHHSSFFSVL